ncbi:N-acetylmuramoyl-L-alanine amidase [Solimonas terrae]|uniref:N-acetylmuramoyl-L-alanine amidase AmiC n=1 Tax=Solimonas terrae TaxID=1396819 RepID=A0A6M2BN66_9GAMM|nr:N-acetylmuramoyl-L-alanine amidase [Solimonas terrae]NGY03605.1 AMIN domain-containing protein [Solimonas terrae]
MRWGIGLILMLLLPLAQAAELRDVRVWDAPDSTRVVLDVSNAAKSHVFTLTKPDRVVIDLDGIDAAGVRKANQTEAKGIVRNVRAGVHGDGVRIVLDVDEPVTTNAFDLAPNDDYGNRVVVDLGRKTVVDNAAVGASAATATPQSAPQSVTAPVLPGTGRLQDKQIVIAVDAGHGGEDPGAHGPSGLLEKNVSLAIARKLALLINTQPNMRAVLTRDGDYYVGLRQRVEIARKQQADMFVSIHCNAFTKRDMHGTAVYVLSDRGVNTEQARWLANRENAADLVGGVELQGKDNDLATVLLDLSQSATMEASFDVGSRILHSMGEINTLQRRDVQQAAFVVLKAPDIPSVLVETAFITNPHEEKLLGSDDYQGKLASGILDGVKGYFHGYRPRQQIVDKEAPHLQQVSASAGGGSLQDAAFSN